MFEVRFAYELHLAGFAPEYEYSAGVGSSTVEFRVPGSPEWLIELVSIRASQTAKRAVRQSGVIYSQTLTSTACDRKQSEEAEMITAEQKIGEKVFTGGSPTKFPSPELRSRHLILVDMRGYLDEGGDVFDYRQMAYGAGGVPQEYAWMIHYWDVGSGRHEPIKGLFEVSNPLASSSLVRERIHYLGFVRERCYSKHEIRDHAYYLANPHLFHSTEEVETDFASYPLQPVRPSGQPE
jgi:hypothetical protein